MANDISVYTTEADVQVESYLNGNISDFRQWLKVTERCNIPLAIIALCNADLDGAEIVYQYLV